MMVRAAILMILMAVFAAETAQARAPLKSLRPLSRPDSSEILRPEYALFDRSSPGLKSVVRPKARPGVAMQSSNQAARLVIATTTASVRRSVRPAPRPRIARSQSLVRTAEIKTQPTPVITRGRRGSVCGVKTIKGKKLAPIPGRLRGCGVSDPVQITSVDGVVLSQASIMDCTTAKALNKWVKSGLKPTIGRLGGGVASLKVVAHYSCRTRNSRAGAKISEHGKGRAIDIAAINLKNGVSLTVLKGWRNKTQGKLLKSVHRSACGPFGTVLGPNADKHHQDHFHFDTARYRSGSYCR